MLTLLERRAIYRGETIVLDAVPSVQQSIARGLASLDKALREKTTVHRAMYREGLGWVDFVWGDEGKWPPDKRGRRKGEKGTSHALEARMRKDGMDHDQAVDLLRRMVRAVAEGEEMRPPMTFGKSMRVVVGKDGTEVHLLKNAGSNAWVLTVFDV